MKSPAEASATTPQVLTGEAQHEALMELHKRAWDAFSVFLKISPRPKEDSRSKEMVFKPQQDVTLRVADYYHYANIVETDPVLGYLDKGMDVSSKGRMHFMKATGLGSSFVPPSLLTVVSLENGYVTQMSQGEKVLIALRRGNISPREHDPPTAGLREGSGREQQPYGIRSIQKSFKEPQKSTVDRFLATLDEMKGYLEAELAKQEQERAAVREKPSQETRNPLYKLLHRFW